MILFFVAIGAVSIAVYFVWYLIKSDIEKAEDEKRRIREEAERKARAIAERKEKKIQALAEMQGRYKKAFLKVGLINKDDYYGANGQFLYEDDINEFLYSIGFKSRIDAILVNLISNYDAEELELKNQQEYYRFIVESGGVVEQAQEQYDAMQALQNEHFNFGKQLIKWAIYDDSKQTDIQVRKFGFQNTKTWFKGAVNNWDAKLHAAFPSEYNLNIDTWSGVSNGQDQAEQTESMRHYFDNHKFQNMFVNTPNIAAAIILLFSAGLAFVTLYSLIATGLAAGFLVWRVLSAMKKYPIRVNAALDNLATCMDEIADFRRYYEDNRAKKDELLSVVEFI